MDAKISERGVARTKRYHGKIIKIKKMECHINMVKSCISSARKSSKNRFMKDIFSNRPKSARLLSQAKLCTGSTSKIGTSITIMLMSRMIPKS